MSDVSKRRRVPRGTPNGGEFANENTGASEDADLEPVYATVFLSERPDPDAFAFDPSDEPVKFKGGRQLQEDVYAAEFTAPSKKELKSTLRAKSLISKDEYDGFDNISEYEDLDAADGE